MFAEFFKTPPGCQEAREENARVTRGCDGCYLKGGEGGAHRRNSGKLRAENHETKDKENSLYVRVTLRSAGLLLTGHERTTPARVPYGCTHMPTNGRAREPGFPAQRTFHRSWRERSVLVRVRRYEFMCVERTHTRTFPSCIPENHAPKKGTRAPDGTG